MNRFPDLSNTRRAGILCKLFSAEIPSVLEFIAGKTSALLSTPATFHDQYDKRLFDFGQWISMGKEIDLRLKSRHKSNTCGLFVILFEGYLACYTSHLLIEYTKDLKPQDSRFAIAVRLLFMV